MTIKTTLALIGILLSSFSAAQKIPVVKEAYYCNYLIANKDTIVVFTQMNVYDDKLVIVEFHEGINNKSIVLAQVREYCGPSGDCDRKYVHRTGAYAVNFRRDWVLLAGPELFIRYHVMKRYPIVRD